MTPNDAFDNLRKRGPLVHCITNYVAMNIAPNIVLAAGASPAMVHALEEVEDFVPLAGALTVNIGTLSTPWAEAMVKAAAVAKDKDLPWVLDPVAHFATPFRSRVTEQLMAQNPTIVRGNASEILALAGESGAGKGVDSGDSVAAAQDAAVRIAQTRACVVAVTGEQDFVTDGTARADIRGGDEIMPKVTALGCSLTTLIGGFAAVSPPLAATVAALTLFAEAGARAAPESDGPSSFSARFVDYLHRLQPGDLDEGRVAWH